MKQIFHIVFMIFLLLISCNDEYFKLENISEEQLKWNVEVISNDINTKGIPITSASDTAFKNLGIIAYHSTELFDPTTMNPADFNLFIPDIEVSKKDNQWIIDGNYFWTQNGMLSFYAYAPYNALGVTVENISSGSPQINYNVPLNVVEQSDLMIAVNQFNLNQQTVPIQLKHALSCIAFYVNAPDLVIDSLGIKGVSTGGTLSLQLDSSGTPVWSNISTPVDDVYYIGLTENAIADSDTSSIMADNGYLMMVPQTLESTASIIVKFNGYDTKEIPLKTSALTAWEPGIRYNYYLNEGSYEFEVIPMDTVCIYSGGNFNFNINSVYKTSAGTVKNIGWTAKVIGSNWLINDSTLNDVSGGLNIAKSVKCGPTSYSTENTDDKALKSATPIQYSDINDLALNSEKYTTSNCYAVNAPGWYKFPCFVMGNGIYENSELEINNTNCFSSDNYFVNYNGDTIKSASDLKLDMTGAYAELVWQDAPNLISEIAISSDNQYIEFYIPKESIRQGNALIALKNGSGTIMWSWHIWVTTWNTSTANEYVGNSYNYYFVMSKNLGYCSGSTYFYDARSLQIEFTQKGSNKTQIVTVYQSDSTFTLADNNVYYQWGRKDPMPGSNGITNSISYLEDKNTYGPDTFYVSPTSVGVYLQTAIQNPNVFYSSTSTTGSWYLPLNLELWGIGSNESPTKSIYDPSPYGYQMMFMPLLNLYVEIGGTWQNGTTPGYVFASYIQNVFIPAMGYRVGDNGMVYNLKNIGSYWSNQNVNSESSGTSTNEYSTYNLQFSSTSNPDQQSSVPAYGFSVRSMAN